MITIETCKHKSHTIPRSMNDKYFTESICFNAVLCYGFLRRNKSGLEIIPSSTENRKEADPWRRMWLSGLLAELLTERRTGVTHTHRERDTRRDRCGWTDSRDSVLVCVWFAKYNDVGGHKMSGRFGIIVCLWCGITASRNLLMSPL